MPKTRDNVASGRRQLERWIIRGRMTQDEAARRIGISRVKLNQYLHGVRRPASLVTGILIEDATGINPRAWLIDDPAPAKSELLAKGESFPQVEIDDNANSNNGLQGNENG